MIVDAKVPHLHKYTEIYRKLYPEAAQILVQCDPSFFWSSQNANVWIFEVCVFDL